MNGFKACLEVSIKTEQIRLYVWPKYMTVKQSKYTISSSCETCPDMIPVLKIADAITVRALIASKYF